MELERNEMTNQYDLFSTIEKASEVIETENGTVKFLIDADYLAKAIVEEELFREIEKGEWSLKNEPTHTRSDFQRKYGLAK